MKGKIVVKGSAVGSLRLTRLQNIVLDTVLSAQEPLSAMGIHSLLRGRAEADQVALVTVYRSLNLLVERQAIRKIILPTGDFLYESWEGPRWRGYFQCRTCGRLIPIKVAKQPAIQGLKGCEIAFYQTLVFGRCRACLSDS